MNLSSTRLDAGASTMTMSTAHRARPARHSPYAPMPTPIHAPPAMPTPMTPLGAALPASAAPILKAPATSDYAFLSCLANVMSA